MARHERSAGVIVYRDNPPGGRTFLLLNYGNYWDYPKGHLEAGETDQEAALRELAEETGIKDVTLDPTFAHEIVYHFRHRARGLVRKEVIFFMGRTQTSEIILSHEHVGYEFLQLEPALVRLKFPNAKALLQAAAEQLAKA